MKTKAFINAILISLLLVLTISACVEPYSLDYIQSKRIVTVDGVLSDNPASNQIINITESIPRGIRNTFSPISKAVVEVILNSSERFTFSEIREGTYAKPEELIIEAGSTYQLEISFSDGRKYESDVESFSSTSTIDRAYTELEIEGIALNTSYTPAHYLYIDTKDKPGVGDNYVWSWKLYERQDICKTCVNGRYFIDQRTGEGTCRDESSPFQQEVIFYDYECDGDCWQLFYNPEINAMSDTYVDGNPIIGRLIGKIPVYQRSGALVEITQQSVSPGAFRYLKLLSEQSQNNGGLADTPPAPLIGNIKSTTNETETVGGYFMIASEQTELLWLDREDVAEQRASVRGLLGRRVSLEVSSLPDRPPLLPCESSRNRTPFKPDGWVD